MANFSKSNVPQFSVDVYQNEFLHEGGREVNAIVTVTSTGGGTSGGRPLPGTATAPNAGVVVMVDCSGSMEYPPTKMRGARDATAVAIDAIRDGVSFAIVAGTHVAREVFPGGGALAVADPATRAQAKQALRKLTSGGGTAIGTWLKLADKLLAGGEVSIRHGILLTDGRNEHEKPEELRAALDQCAGRFTCDARGVGTDWEVKEVTGIASALLGSVDIIADPAGLAADFQAMMQNAMGKEVADVVLRLWTPHGSEISFVKQVAPTVEDLTARRAEAGPRALSPQLLNGHRRLNPGDTAGREVEQQRVGVRRRLVRPVHDAVAGLREGPDPVVRYEDGRVDQIAGDRRPCHVDVGAAGHDPRPALAMSQDAAGTRQAAEDPHTVLGGRLDHIAPEPGREVRRRRHPDPQPQRRHLLGGPVVRVPAGAPRGHGGKAARRGDPLHRAPPASPPRGDAGTGAGAGNGAMGVASHGWPLTRGSRLPARRRRRGVCSAGGPHAGRVFPEGRPRRRWPCAARARGGFSDNVVITRISQVVAPHYGRRRPQLASCKVQFTE